MHEKYDEELPWRRCHGRTGEKRAVIRHTHRWCARVNWCVWIVTLEAYSNRNLLPVAGPVVNRVNKPRWKSASRDNYP